MTDTTRYHSWVEYEADGEARTLSIEFDGGPTDYYWNHGVARDFYAEQIAENGGVIRAYGTGPAGRGRPEKLTVTFNVAGLSAAQVSMLEGEVAAQAEASDNHPDVEILSSEVEYVEEAVAWRREQA